MASDIAHSCTFTIVTPTMYHNQLIERTNKNEPANEHLHDTRRRNNSWKGTIRFGNEFVWSTSKGHVEQLIHWRGDETLSTHAPKMPATCYIPHHFHMCHIPKNSQRKLLWHYSNPWDFFFLESFPLYGIPQCVYYVHRCKQSCLVCALAKAV